jgi:capsular exopolysaccharide synthesis family protein
MMANTLADAFIARSQSLKLSTTRDATDWLSAEMKEARKNLETSELALQRYKEANDIVSLENRQNMVVLKLEELNTVLTEAKTSRIAFETRYQQMQKVITDGELVDTLPEVIENSFVQELKGEYSRLQNELSDLSKTYTPKHPKIIRLKSQMESIQKQLDGEVEKVIASIENEYQVALAKEKSLQKAVDQQKQEVQALNQRSIKYGALEREVENNRRIFNTLLGRAKETGLAEGLQTGNIHIVDRAEIPLAPFSPRKRRSLMLAIMVGLLGGVGLTFFFDYLDDSIKDPDDLEEHAQLPLLASVPVIKTRRGKGPKELVADKDTKSFYAEAYRSARTSIIFSSPDSQPETILVTSPGPQDGKTLTAVNLAITMAHAGNRVLLMDGDLRRPRIHSVFGLTNDFGLTNLLTESTDIKLSLRNTDILNLAVMTSGPIPPNPSELFVSKRMGVLLETLMKRFDRIIIDSPPTISVTDANILAAVTDGVVLVIKAGKTSRRIVNRAKKNLEEVQGKLLGVILNAVDMRRSRYYYVPSYYYKYYGKHRERKRKAG